MLDEVEAGVAAPKTELEEGVEDAPKTEAEEEGAAEAPKTEAEEEGVAEAPKTEAEEVGAAPNTELEPPNGDPEDATVLLAAPNTDPDLGVAGVGAPNTDPEPPNAEGVEVADDPKTEDEVATAPKDDDTVLAGVVDPNGDESGVLVVAAELKTEGFEPPNGEAADEAGAGLPNMEDAEVAGLPNAEELEDPNADWVVATAEVAAPPKTEEVDLPPKGELRVGTDVVVAGLELPKMELLV